MGAHDECVVESCSDIVRYNTSCGIVEKVTDP